MQVIPLALGGSVPEILGRHAEPLLVDPSAKKACNPSVPDTLFPAISRLVPLDLTQNKALPLHVHRRNLSYVALRAQSADSRLLFSVQPSTVFRPAASLFTAASVSY